MRSIYDPTATAKDAVIAILRDQQAYAARTAQSWSESSKSPRAEQYADRDREVAALLDRLANALDNCELDHIVVPLGTGPELLDDIDAEAFVDAADAERYAQRDEYVNGLAATEAEAIAYVEAAQDVDPDGSRGPVAGEHFDGAEAADVRQIEHDMAIEAGMECDPETCAYCGGA